MSSAKRAILPQHGPVFASRRPYPIRSDTVLADGIHHPHGPPELLENIHSSFRGTAGFLARCTFQHHGSETDCLATEPQLRFCGTRFTRHSVFSDFRRPRSLARRSLDEHGASPHIRTRRESLHGAPNSPRYRINLKSRHAGPTHIVTHGSSFRCRLAVDIFTLTGHRSRTDRPDRRSLRPRSLARRSSDLVTDLVIVTTRRATSHRTPRKSRVLGLRSHHITSRRWRVSTNALPVPCFPHRVTGHGTALCTDRSFSHSHRAPSLRHGARRFRRTLQGFG